MIFRLLENIKNILAFLASSILLILGFILQFGIGGVIVVILLLLFFEEVWLETLIVIALLCVAGFFGMRFYNKYLAQKNNYVEKTIQEVSIKKFEKYKSDLKTIDLVAVESKPYLVAASKNLPLEEQVSFYKESLSKLERSLARLDNIYPNSVYRDNAKMKVFNTLPQDIRNNLSKLVNTDFYYLYQDFKKDVSFFLNETNHNHRIVKIGVEGENKMRNALETLAIKEDFFSLENAVLKYENKSFETDFLLFTKHGIFSLEVKNIGGSGNFSILITKDGQWLKKLKNGETETMQDISEQVNYHISLTEAILKRYKQETGKSLPPVTPMVIIANNEVQIENNSELLINRVGYFPNQLSNMPVVSDTNSMKEVYEWIQKFSVSQKSYQVLDYSDGINKSIEDFFKLQKQVELLNQYFTETVEELKKDKFMNGKL